MVVVAQLVRAPDCGSGGRRFETDLPPKLVLSLKGLFFMPQTSCKKLKALFPKYLRTTKPNKSKKKFWQTFGYCFSQHANAAEL